VTPGYPASRLGGVELQVMTKSGWATRDRAQVRPVTTASGPRNLARYRLSTRFDGKGKQVLRVVKGPGMCSDDGCRVAANTSKRFSVLVGDPAYLVEARLNQLNVPVGTVDGVVDDRSRQAFCAWRDMAGQPVSRRGLTPKLVRSVMHAKDLPSPRRTNGLYVNKTCQVLFQVKRHEFKRVVWVSTGMPGHETPNGTGAIFRKVKGWVESTLYPGAFMLDPMFFFPNRPGIALHGSVSNSLVLPHPASHGCVRTWRPQIRKIFNESPLGTKVRVYGRY
jgi:L,D-transpeptidase catalytic domain